MVSRRAPQNRLLLLRQPTKCESCCRQTGRGTLQRKVVLLPQGNPHKYTTSVVTLCSAGDAVNQVKNAGNSAPGAPAAQEGFTPQIILTGNNPISQSVNSSSGTIVNTTLRGHEFYFGTVVIQVSPITPVSSTITITGTGTGSSPLLNDLVGLAFFGPLADVISSNCAAQAGAPPANP